MPFESANQLGSMCHCSLIIPTNNSMLSVSTWHFSRGWHGCCRCQRGISVEIDTDVVGVNVAFRSRLTRMLSVLTWHFGLEVDTDVVGVNVAFRSRLTRMLSVSTWHFGRGWHGCCRCQRGISVEVDTVNKKLCNINTMQCNILNKDWPTACRRPVDSEPRGLRWWLNLVSWWENSATSNFTLASLIPDPAKCDPVFVVNLQGWNGQILYVNNLDLAIYGRLLGVIQCSKKRRIFRALRSDKVRFIFFNLRIYASPLPGFEADADRKIRTGNSLLSQKKHAFSLDQRRSLSKMRILFKYIATLS